MTEIDKYDPRKYILIMNDPPLDVMESDPFLLEPVAIDGEEHVPLSEVKEMFKRVEKITNFQIILSRYIKRDEYLAMIETAEAEAKNFVR
jgi:hypothetical protein